MLFLVALWFLGGLFLLLLETVLNRSSSTGGTISMAGCPVHG